MTNHRHDLLREGLTTGILGAAAVAGWFLVTDLIQGRPLSTPSILGQVILYGRTTPVITPVEIGPALAYTLLHVGAFVLFGIGVTQLVHLAMASPLARFGLMIVAVVFELFFFMITYMLFAGTLHLFPWWSVLAANTLALVAMGYYLGARHRSLGRQLAGEPLGGSRRSLAPATWPGTHRGPRWAPSLFSGMTMCPRCGAPLDAGASTCPYEVPLDQAPGIGDPGLIAKGKMSHASHEVHIARWRVHHPADRGATPQVMEWARERLAKEGHRVPPA